MPGSCRYLRGHLSVLLDLGPESWLRHAVAMCCDLLDVMCVCTGGRGGGAHVRSGRVLLLVAVFRACLRDADKVAAGHGQRKSLGKVV